MVVNPSVQERIQEAGLKAESFESPFFYYLSHLVQMIGHFIEARKISDPFFTVKLSGEGKELLGLARQMKQKMNMYKEKIGQESFQRLLTFIKEFEGDYFGKMDAQTEKEIFDLTANRMEYNPNVILEIEAVYSILALPKTSRSAIQMQAGVRRKTNKKTTLMQLESRIEEKYKWDSKETPLLCFEITETSELVIQVSSN